MKRLRQTMAGGLAVAAAFGACGGAISTGEILAASADVGCLDVRVAGACLWLNCATVTGCSTETSVKWRHFVPDAVVTAYGARSEHPWPEAGAVLGGWASSDGGTFGKGAAGRSVSSLRFRMAEVVGSPGIAWVERLAESMTLCESDARPLAGYYASAADPAWRVEPLQIGSTLRHLARWVGGLRGERWGPVYPRAGFVQQPHDYKASAVVAQRAADLVTRERQWHVYRRLPSRSRPGHWGPPAVTENDASTHKWQLLAPRVRGCAVFGAGGPRELAGNVSRTASYAWNLWRPYECCERKGQVLLAHW